MTPTYALSVNEFCNSYKISRTHLYNLIKCGLGPRVVKLGRRSIISVEDAKIWYEKTSSSQELNRK